jgi:hypothetical protein
LSGRAIVTVYFIGGDFDRVKIGFTERDVSERLRDLQCGSPVQLRVLASCPGEQHDEHGLHYDFREERTHGEWFTLSPRLWSLVQYDMEFGTLSGWQRALEEPERFAAYAKTFGTASGFGELDGAPEHEIVWRTRVGAGATYRSNYEDVRDWRQAVATWTQAGDVRSVATHLPCAANFRRDFCWRFRHGGQAVQATYQKGLDLVAFFLCETSHSAELTAAVWLQACAKDFCGRLAFDGEYHDLYKKCPAAKALIEWAAAAFPIEWARGMTSVLPDSLELPEHAVLSRGELIKACAQLFIVTFCKYEVFAYWEENACGFYPRRDAEAAA